jgi:3-oxoadipate enol-lactonase
LTRSRLVTGQLEWAEAGSEDRGLVLLHSLGTDRRMWQPQIRGFTSMRRVVTIDLPGHGGSAARPGEYTLDELGRDVLAIASEAGLARFDFCGISLGGLIGLWLAINAPDRIAILVVSNTATRIGSGALWSERIRAVSEGGMAGVRAQVVPRFLSEDFPERDPETFALVEEMFLSVDPTGYVGCCAALRDADLSGEVGSIDCPTVIITGGLDVATPPEEAESLHRSITGSRLEMIPGAAHLASLDQPDAFTKLVVTALDMAT